MKRDQQKTQRGGPRKPCEAIQEQWTTKCERSFEWLKESLVEAPVLAYADPSKPYELHVIHSKDGLGGVLYQESEGKLCQVAYVSRSLTPLRTILCINWSSWPSSRLW